MNGYASYCEQIPVLCGLLSLRYCMVHPIFRMLRIRCFERCRNVVMVRNDFTKLNSYTDIRSMCLIDDWCSVFYILTVVIIIMSVQSLALIFRPNAITVACTNE